MMINLTFVAPKETSKYQEAFSRAKLSTFQVASKSKNVLFSFTSQYIIIEYLQQKRKPLEHILETAIVAREKKNIESG